MEAQAVRNWSGGGADAAPTRALVAELHPTILVIDDEPIIRDLVRVLLRGTKYAVAAAANGAEALSLLREGLSPLMIILDLKMPVMNGWEFRIEQLADETIRDIPVIIVTGGAERPMDIALLNTAATLRKPIDADALLGTIERIEKGR